MKSRVTYFLLRALTGIDVSQSQHRKNSGEILEKNAGEWIERVEISKEEISCSRRSMHGYVRKCSRLQRGNLWVLGRQQMGVFNFCVPSTALRGCGAVTNEQVRAKIQRAIRPREDLLTIVNRCKLQWYGHVSRSSGLAKTTLSGTVKGGRRQGRQRKRWEGNIREWTGLEFGKSQRAVESREKWRKLVEESSVVPQRPSWLRDWWWWWWWTMGGGLRALPCMYERTVRINA